MNANLCKCIAVSTAAVLLFLGGIFFWSHLTGIYVQNGSDFMQDYFSAQMVLEGKSIYGENITAAAYETTGIEGISNFHPPSAALFFIPLTFLNYTSAFWAWNFIALVLYMVSVWMVSNYCGISMSGTFLLQGVLLFWYPFIYGTALGQSSSVIAFCIILCWFLLSRDGQISAGIALGIACLFKLFPLFLVAYLATRRLWRALSAAILTVVAGILLTFVFVGGSDVRRYFFEVAGNDIVEWGAFSLNTSIAGLFYPLLTENGYARTLVDNRLFAEAIILLFSGVLILLTLLKLLRTQKVRRDPAVSYGLACVAMMLVSPITWTHIFPVLLIPLLVAFKKAMAQDNKQLFRATLLVLVMLSVPDVTIANILAEMYYPNGVPAIVFAMTRVAFWGLCFLWLVLYRWDWFVDKEEPDSQPIPSC